MEIVGIGTDVTECLRIGRMIEKHGERFLERCFTPAEIAYCNSHKGSVERFTGRFAAKESILKTLGTGWTRGISWLDMEILNLPSGEPYAALAGEAREHAMRRGVGSLRISISHCRTHAIAFAIAVDQGELPWASPTDVE